jgi:flagellar hook-basal body complex protein FliE
MDVKQAANAYNAVAGITQNTIPDNTAKTSPANDASFSELVTQALSGAVDSGYKAEKVSTLALMGKADITDVATAVSSAELALNTVVAIRDKVISAYQSILQMPM